MSPAYGMPGLSEPWDKGRDLYLWAIPGLVFAVTVPVLLFLLCWRRVLAFERNSRTVCVETPAAEMESDPVSGGRNHA
jgi:hypothetical protein